jgi:predicted molibdopterin-dependent oxidoreductase YjgC
MSHPSNEGRICVRGWNVHEIASSPDRLKTPLIRRNGRLEPTTLEEAYREIARRLAEIKSKHGPAAIGFLNSARCANEEGYLLQKLARAVIGSNHVDQGTSLYRSQTVEALRDQLGIPAASASVADLKRAGVVILHDIDIGQQLPTIGGALMRAHLAGTRLIVISARRHRLAEHADLFLSPRPGTERYLYAAMAKTLVDRGLMDSAFIARHCENYERFVHDIQSFDILQAARRCDIPVSSIEEAARLFGETPRGMLLYATGAEAQGRDLLGAMINLVLLTGNLGKPGCGVMPLCEHNNVQGGCDMGMLPGYLPGYAPVSDDSARSRFERAWNAPLPDRSGLDALHMLGEGTPLKALWLDRHNPVLSARYSRAAEALKQMEFIVLQNLFMTKTGEDFAHVILPTTAFGEEEVSFTNTERRIQLAPKATPGPAGLEPAWKQIAEVARRLGAAWKYPDSESVLREAASLIPEYAAVTHERLARGYGRQWPCTLASPAGAERLFENGPAVHPFRFAPMRPASAEPAEDKAFPLRLAFGHSLYYWHQNTFVRHSSTLKREYGILLLDFPGGFVELNHEDAKALGIRNGERITLSSPAGSAGTWARVTEEIRRGIVYVPFFQQDIMHQLEPQKAPPGAGRLGVRVGKAA